MTAVSATCAIHQPNFFPRLSTLAKLFACDTWVILDDVQFTRRDYQHRCRLAGLRDAADQQWLTIPVHLPSGRATRIGDVRVAEPELARTRIARLLQQYYGRSPYWCTLRAVLGEVLGCLDRTDRLAGVSIASTQALLTLLGWPGTAYLSSELRPCNGRSERLADLALAAGASTYVCGTGGARYLDHAPFLSRGLGVEFFTPPGPAVHPLWQQASRVTAVRALMAVGPDGLGQEFARVAGNRHCDGSPTGAWRSGDRPRERSGTR